MGVAHMKTLFYICKKENFKPTDTSNVRWLEENDDFDLVRKFRPMSLLPTPVCLFSIS